MPEGFEAYNHIIVRLPYLSFQVNHVIEAKVLDVIAID